MDTKFEPEIESALKNHQFEELRKYLKDQPPTDIVNVIRWLSPENQVIAFRVLPRSIATATFEYLRPEEQRVLIKAMGHHEVALILNDMAPDDRTRLLEELPAAATKQLLNLLDPAEKATAVKLLGYPEGSIGRLMTPNYIAVHRDWTVQYTLDYIREHGKNTETLSYLYVVDDAGKLIDDIRIHKFLLAPINQQVAELMDNHVVALNASSDQGEALQIFRTEDRKAMPVLDSTGILIGIVTIDDVLDVAEKQTTQEIQRIGGSEALDAPYMQIPFWKMVKKRASWLIVLFLGEMLTATAMGFFEGEIQKAVVLALFLPLIISSGGNSGSQATTLVIRAMALGEVKLRDWWRVMRREITSGFALGCILGAIGFLRIVIWAAVSTTYGPHWLLVAMTVGTSLIGIVMWGSIAGSMLPFILRRSGFDPATASAPFVATLVDVTGLVIYFSVGMVILRGTLL
jgi:magnesium transporter